MGKGHDRKVKLYSNPENLGFLDDEITKVVAEKRFKDVFPKCYSELTPDIFAFTDENEVWIGEIKGNGCVKNIEKARNQLGNYIYEAHRYRIPCAGGFVIAGDYIEVMPK